MAVFNSRNYKLKHPTFTQRRQPFSSQRRKLPYYVVMGEGTFYRFFPAILAWEQARKRGIGRYVLSCNPAAIAFSRFSDLCSFMRHCR